MAASQTVIRWMMTYSSDEWKAGARHLNLYPYALNISRSASGILPWCGNGRRNDPKSAADALLLGTATRGLSDVAGTRLWRVLTEEAA